MSYWFTLHHSRESLQKFFFFLISAQRPNQILYKLMIVQEFNCKEVEEAQVLRLELPPCPQVSKLRTQVEEQETSLKAQEEEVMSKRQELTDLKNQENQLEETVATMKKRIDELSNTQQDTQLHISQVQFCLSCSKYLPCTLACSVCLYGGCHPNS